MVLCFNSPKKLLCPPNKPQSGLQYFSFWVELKIKINFWSHYSLSAWALTDKTNSRHIPFGFETHVIGKKTNYLLSFPNVFYKVTFLIRIIKFLFQRAPKCKHYGLISCKESFPAFCPTWRPLTREAPSESDITVTGLWLMSTPRRGKWERKT